jgi:hypothetical protein
VDQFYYESGYIDDSYFVYIADAASNPVSEFAIVCDADVIPGGEIVDFEATLNIQGSISVTVNKIIGASVDLNSEFTQTTFASRATDIDLFAFGEAAISAAVSRLRDNNVETSTVFSVSAEVARQRNLDADADAIFESMVNGLRSRATSMATQAAFSLTAGAGAIRNFSDYLGTSNRTAKTVTVTGNTFLDNTQSQFGGRSARFDGANDRLDVSSSIDFAFDTGNFTVEAWIRPTDNTNVVLFENRNTGISDSNGWVWFINNNRDLVLQRGTSVILTGSEEISTNVWTHVALTRSSGTFRFFINGQLSRSASPTSQNFTNTNLRIGEGVSGTTFGDFNGWMDDVRINKGTALYTANFTAPASQLTDVSGTVLLLNMNLVTTTTNFVDTVTTTFAYQPRNYSSAGTVVAQVNEISGGQANLNSQFAQTASATATKPFDSSISSTASLSALAFTTKDIVLTAFTDGALTAAAARSRDTESQQTFESAVSADVDAVKGIIADLSAESQFSSVVNISAVGSAFLQGQSAFASTPNVLTRRTTLTNLSTAPDNQSVIITNADKKFGVASAYFGTGTGVSGSLSAVNNQFIRLGAGYTWTSSDGQSWTRFANNLTESRSINTYANGLYLYYNISTRKIGYSSDLSTWTETTNLANPANDNLFRTAIIFHNSRYYLIYHRLSSGTQRIQRYISSSNNIATATWSFDGEIFNTGITGTPDIQFKSKGTYAIYGVTNAGAAGDVFVGAWGSITRNTVAAAPVTTGRIKRLGDNFDYDGSNTWAIRFHEDNTSGNFISGSGLVRYSTDNGTNWTSTTAYGTGEFGNLGYQGDRWIIGEGTTATPPSKTYFGTTPINAVEKLPFTKQPVFANNRWLFSSQAIGGRYGVSTDTDTWTYYDQNNSVGSSARLIYSRGDDSDLANFGTIDFWFKVNGVSKFGDVFYLPGNTENIGLRYSSGSSGAPNAGSLDFRSERVSTTNQLLNTHTNWNHVRISRSGSTTSLYYNGSRIYTGTDIVWPSTARAIVTGNDVYVDEFLISEDVKTDPSLTSFAVPTEPWQNTSDVDLLLHFDTDFADDAVYIVVVEADLVTESALFVTTSNTIVGLAGLTSQSQVSVTAAKNSEIILTAFSDAALTADIRRNRFGASTQSSEFTQTTQAVKQVFVSSTTNVETAVEVAAVKTVSVTVSTDSIATQLTAAAKVGDIIIDIDSEFAQTTVAVKTVSAESAQATVFQLTGDGDLLVDYEADLISTTTAVIDSDRTRSTSVALASASTQTTAATKTVVAQSTLTVNAVMEAATPGVISAGASLLVVTGALTAQGTLTKDNDVSANAQTALTASIDIITDITEELFANTQSTVIFGRDRSTLVTTSSIATQLTAVAVTSVTSSQITVTATIEVDAIKTTGNASIQTVDSALTAEVGIIKTADSAQSASFAVTAEGSLDVFGSAELSANTALTAQVQKTTEIILTAFSDAAVTATPGRTRTASSLQNAETNVDAEIGRLISAEITTNSIATQLTIGGQIAGGISMQVSAATLAIEPRVLNLTLYVYQISAESRQRVITNETRTYQVRR